jgi:hypothetical protein
MTIDLLLDQFDPLCSSLIMCSSVCIYSSTYVATTPYSWELTFCGRVSNGFKVYFDTFFIPPMSLLELSLPSMRSTSSSYVVPTSNGLAPSIYLVFSSSYEVSSFGVRTKGSY